MTGKKIKLISTRVDITTQERAISGMGLSTYRVNDDEETKPRPYIIGASGCVWMDDDGELYTSSMEVHTGELVPPEFGEELYNDDPQ